MKDSFFIFIIYFCIRFINSSDNRIRHYGKCIYIEKDTGSKIINFHKYARKENLSKNTSFFINFCNDTIYLKFENGSYKDGIDSQIAYLDRSTNISASLAGPFFSLKNVSWKSSVILNKNEGKDIYIYKPQFGDFCISDNNSNYSTSFIFEHKDFEEEEKIEITDYPDINNCTPVLKMNFNIEFAKDYLLLQSVLNDCYILTGIVFILLGIFLCFLSFKFQAITKIIISIIFGQLIIFNIDLMFIGNSTSLKEYYYILIILLGLVIGAPFIFLIRKSEKLYYIILSFSSGYICGVFFYQIFFFKTNSILSRSILIDVLLIFTSSFIGLNLMVPRNYIYYPAFIGSYILIRGISLFIYNAADTGGFGDLQLIIYLVMLREQDLAEEYFANDYKYFYVYLIFIGIVLITSEVIIFFLNKNNDDITYSDLDDDETGVTFQSMNKLEEK